MKKIFRSSLVASVLVVTATAAHAQMYWRADLGYSQANNADIHDKNFDNSGIICGDAFCDTGGSVNKIGSSSIIGGGVGYRFAPNVRGDVTLGYRGGYKLDDTEPGGANARVKADITSLALMANGYYDFATSSKWSPYLGAGLGYAQNKADNPTASFGGVTIHVPGGTASGLAWALTAGLSYQLSGQYVLDIAYRYVDLGKIETDSGTGTTTGVPGVPSLSFAYDGATGRLTAQELSIGLRF
jgi:opacity protein-like surface antigen